MKRFLSGFLSLFLALSSAAAARAQVLETPLAAPESASSVPAAAPGAETLSDPSIPQASLGASAGLAQSLSPNTRLEAAPKPEMLERTSRGPASTLGRAVQAVRAGLFKSDGSRFFDRGSSFAQGVIAAPYTELSLRSGVALDAKPRAPKEGGVRLEKVHLSREPSLEDGSKPLVLDADPSDASSVEKALRKLVDSDPEKYGASSEDMAKVHVELFRGSKERGQADTIYAVFRQWKKGQDRDGSPYYLMVDGSNLTFNIKVFADGKPVVMATHGRLFPGISSAIMTPGYSDEELESLAEKRLLAPKGASKARHAVQGLLARAARTLGLSDEQKPTLITRQIVNANGAWRALNIYDATDLKGQPVIVAVDVKTGESFAWDDRSLVRKPAGTELRLRTTQAGIEGLAEGRGTSLTKEGDDHGPTLALPLPFAKVFDERGNAVAMTAEDGTFTVPGTGGPVKLTVRLDGKYGKVVDEDSDDAPLVQTVLARPGEKATILLNDLSDSEEMAADVNAYVYVSKQIAWLKDAARLDDPRIQAPLSGGIRTNRTDMPGNAYEDPATDSINLERAATVKQKVKGKDGRTRTVTLRLENTAQASIIFHEITHRAVQVLSQLELTPEQLTEAAYRFVKVIMDPVMEGGVNEAIADTVSMFMRGNPNIGTDFMKPVSAQGGGEQGPVVIRSGDNDTKFDPKDDDPHGRGEAFMGFTWKVRKALIEALGETEGAAYASLMMVPSTLLAQPQDVPVAMLHVLLAGMTTDGAFPHEAAVRKAAAAHDVALPASPSPKPSA